MPHTTLFVIINPTRQEQPALRRAIDIANITGGHIHAFCAVYDPHLSGYTSRRDAKYSVCHQAADKLDEVITQLANDRITIEKEVIWNEHWYQSAVHACARVGADMMIKSTYRSSQGPGVASKRSNYYLLRHSCCPVLLTQSTESYPYLRVLAAIAIEDGDNRHNYLNNLVISQARRICRKTGAELHAVAALGKHPDIASFLNIAMDEDDEEPSIEEMIHLRFGIETENVHLGHGTAEQVISDTVKKDSVQLLVLGTVARSGISGAVLGNTCEKSLQQLSIDILTVN